jgi:hypothetical protein
MALFLDTWLPNATITSFVIQRPPWSSNFSNRNCCHGKLSRAFYLPRAPAKTGEITHAVNVVQNKIAWKATPRLRDHLLDLQLDAEADREDI